MTTTVLFMLAVLHLGSVPYVGCQPEQFRNPDGAIRLWRIGLACLIAACALFDAGGVSGLLGVVR